MTGGRHQVVGRVQVNGAQSRTVDGHPGVRSVGSNESFPIGWSNGLQITAHVTRRQTDGAEAGNLEMGEVLTNTSPFLKDFLYRRRHLLALVSYLKSR